MLIIQRSPVDSMKIGYQLEMNCEKWLKQVKDSEKEIESEIDSAMEGKPCPTIFYHQKTFVWRIYDLLASIQGFLGKWHKLIAYEEKALKFASPEHKIASYYSMAVAYGHLGNQYLCVCIKKSS